VSNDVRELEAKKLNLRKRIAELRAELEPLAAKTDALREKIQYCELDLTSIYDLLREAQRQ
jgi:predicted  nucleic acid-binding Zn-ribbon protein